jgi:gamma-tubulin complex component 2
VLPRTLTRPRPLRPAGKYLNAMRECGAAVPPSPLPGGALRYDGGGAYLDAIHAALHAASGALLRLMLGQGQLMGWLRSIKHFFLLDQVGGGGVGPVGR